MSPEQNPELFEAIDRLYDIFEAYAFSVDASSDDLGVEDRNRVLHATPLRQLGEEELRRYVFKAMTTWGSVDDFRHLLPRLVELFILQAGRTLFEPEIMFGKLRYGRWTTWPIDEQIALRRFFHVLWRDVLARWPNEPTAILSLSCVAEAEDELLPYLQAWDIAGSRSCFSFRGTGGMGGEIPMGQSSPCISTSNDLGRPRAASRTVDGVAPRARPRGRPGARLLCVRARRRRDGGHTF